ncbi:MAG: ribosome biogenesis GTP-binding protein YsxC [Deltaproteobacteria bacterium]|nr:MAG: ribosome biogenesis GTP-binding protein YsxC [Deltaproteobacteria bacterium]
MPPTDRTAARRGRSGAGSRPAEASFVLSAATCDQLPAPDLAEVAVAGRSNVGKSSLLGALLGRPGLVRTSKTPGSTVLLNLFEVEVAGPEGPTQRVRLVDLPGYGFAARGARERARLAARIEAYLAARRCTAVLLLLDLRRGVLDADLEFVEAAAAHAHRLVLVGTKVDKIPRSRRGAARRRIADAFGVAPRDVHVTSARTREGVAGPGGLTELLCDLAGGERSIDVARSTLEIDG